MNKKNIKLFSPVNETIGQRLARFRKEAGLTQRELAAKLDISRSCLAEYERNRFRLHSILIIKIANLLKVSSDEILGLKGNKNYEAKPSLRFLKRLKEIEKLSELRKKEILRTLDDLIFASENKKTS